MESSIGDVRVVSRCLVRPEPQPACSPPEVIHLTPWDLSLMTVDHNQYGILLPADTNPRAQVVGDLASSLARALGRFYPLAGRLVASSESSEPLTGGGEPSASPAGPVISLCCNGEGAEFIHAVAPGVTMSDITAPLYVPSVVPSGLFPLTGVLNVEAAVGSLPLLAAQVTELADGVFVAVSLNHGVADGTTLWHLFNTWSEINRRSRGAAGGEEGDELSTPLPALERWVLGTRPGPIHLAISGKLEDIIQRRRPQHTPTQECFLNFSAESVKKLKAKANAEMAGTATATISSLQALLAHLWRAVCRARGLAPHVETTHKLVVGLRGRVRGVPMGYVGSPVTYAVATATAGDVQEKGLGQAAWLLNRAVASFDEAVVRDDLASSWGQKKPVRLRRVVPRRNPARLVTSGSPRFDVYGNDFGWGRPVAVRSGAGDKVDGKVMVYEGRDGGGAMALEVCLSPEALARLVADEEFMEAVS